MNIVGKELEGRLTLWRWRGIYKAKYSGEGITREGHTLEEERDLQG